MGIADYKQGWKTMNTISFALKLVRYYPVSQKPVKNAVSSVILMRWNPSDKVFKVNKWAQAHYFHLMQVRAIEFYLSQQVHIWFALLN